MAYEAERRRMVDHLLSSGYVKSPGVADAMLSVPRHGFIPEGERHAYVDSPQSIGCGQTISAPHMVGIMLELLELGDGLKVLEVGAGSGYNAACMVHMVRPGGHVYSTEYVPELASLARRNIERTGYSKWATVIHGDGSEGLKKHAPFDRITVTCAAPSIPPPLVEQLDKGGIMLIPSGGRWTQDLIIIRKKEDGDIAKEEWGGCVFVPLRGKFGFD
jgi:protein-L-isoaspartate(D-aspartate) O-methyltransferase